MKAWEMVLWEKHMLCKLEEWSLEPQNPHKDPDRQSGPPVTPVCIRSNTGNPQSKLASQTIQNNELWVQRETWPHKMKFDP